MVRICCLHSISLTHHDLMCVCVCVCVCERFGFMQFIDSDFKQMTESELNSSCPERNTFNAAKI